MTESSAPPGGRSGTLWFLAGYAGVAGFFLMEASARQHGSASSLATSRDDRGTTRLIVVAYATTVVAAPMLRRLSPEQLPRAAGPVGVGLQALGLGLRAWSMRTLGRSYTRTLRTEQAQRIVDTGPYRFVRHPGYAGSLLIWTGFALTSRNWLVVQLVGGLIGGAYHRRVAAEETLLRRELSGYDAYAARTKRLVPFVW